MDPASRYIVPVADAWLDDFLRRQFFAPHHDGRCLRLQLFHLAGKHRGVRNWPVPERVEESALPEWEHDILSAAQADASDLFGRQRYSICAYYERQPTTVAESKPFTRDGGGAGVDDGGEDSDSEPPTEKGLTRQLMRHLEGTTRLMVANTQTLLKAQGDVFAVTAKRLAESEGQRFQMTQMYESMLSEHHARQLAAKEHEQKMKMWEEAFDKVKLLLPLAVNKIAGARIMPEPASMQNEMLGSFIDTITPEQVEAMQSIMKPEQFYVIMELVKARMDETNRRNADAAAAAAEAARKNGAEATA